MAETKTTAIESLSNDLSKEIASRPSFDVNEISNLIAVRIKNEFPLILREQTNEMEAEYTRLLERKAVYSDNGKVITEINNKLSLLRQKLAIANRIENNSKREESILTLKQKHHLFREKLCDAFGRNSIIKIESDMDIKNE